VYVVGESQISVTLVGLAATVTLSVVDADTPPETAVIVVVPSATAVASPFDPAALLTVATPVDEELQVTDAVRSWVELSV
jgi:hypothetical protein